MSMKKKEFYLRINKRMDKLEMFMENNIHLEKPLKVYNHTLKISKFWPLLSEEDREYIQCAQNAIEDGTKWK